MTTPNTEHWHHDRHALLRSRHAWSDAGPGFCRAASAGCRQRLLAGLISMVPDWDALSSNISQQSYQAVHRVWGHNLFVVAFAGAFLGTLGWWIQRSVDRRTEPGTRPASLTLWLLLGVVIMVSHVLMDVLYCGGFGSRTWPVQLLWPLTSAGFAYPCVPWTDWPTTLILALGLLVACLAWRRSQTVACIALVILAGNVLWRRLWGM